MQDANRVAPIADIGSGRSLDTVEGAGHDVQSDHPTCSLASASSTLANGAIGADEAVRHILTTALFDARLEELDDACGLLDLSLPEGGWGVSRPLGVLLAYAGDDLGRLTTVVLAVALARGERTMAKEPSRTAGPRVATCTGRYSTPRGSTR